MPAFQSRMSPVMISHLTWEASSISSEREERTRLQEEKLLPLHHWGERDKGSEEQCAMTRMQIPSPIYTSKTNDQSKYISMRSTMVAVLLKQLTGHLSSRKTKRTDCQRDGREMIPLPFRPSASPAKEKSLTVTRFPFLISERQ